MLIECTKKLLDELKIKPTDAAEENPLFSWHANLITINRRKTVVLCNDANRYIVVLYGLKAKDFKHLDKLIVDGIKNTLLAEHINPEIVDRYIEQSTGIVYGRTKDRQTTAWLNKACDHAHFSARQIESAGAYRDNLGTVASYLSVGTMDDDRSQPSEAMRKDLECFGITPIISYTALELMVQLDLTNHNVWRKIIIPAGITFEQLHKVLQTAFGWKNCHLHDFVIFDGEKPVINLVPSEEDLGYPSVDVEMKPSKGVLLSDYTGYKRIKYTYDYGDSWEHYIEITGVFENYTDDSPACVAGEGNSPPEDVGGDGGFDEFLRIMADHADEEYEDMKEWGKAQGYKEFDLEQVNRQVASCLRW